jgi:hypothetical protein
MISILQDEGGGLIREYQKLVLQAAQDGVGIFDPQGAPVPVSERHLLGLRQDHEDYGSIGGFLLASGFHEDDCEGIVERFELRSQAYLPFRMLTPTAQRQMELLALMHTPEHAETRKLLLLDDPFQPFSGRWRETFAELLLTHVRTHGVACVIFNLSFRPNAWLEQREVREVNLLELDQRAIQRHFDMKVEEERQQEQAAKASSKSAATAESPPQTKNGKRQDLIDPSLGPLGTPSNGRGDAVVRFLSRVSSSVRSAHGAVGFAGIAALVLAIGFVSYPEAKARWQKMHELGTEISVVGATEGGTEEHSLADTGAQWNGTTTRDETQGAGIPVFDREEPVSPSALRNEGEQIHASQDKVSASLVEAPGLSSEDIARLLGGDLECHSLRVEAASNG